MATNLIRINPTTIQATLPAFQSEKEQIVDRDVVLVLDVSGSMSNIREWNVHIFNELVKITGRVRLICFDGSFVDHGVVSQMPANYFTGGQTNFYLVLNHLLNLKFAPNTIIFFSTDGEVNNWRMTNNHWFSQNEKDIAEQIYDRKFSVDGLQVNVFGISSSSDTKCLFKISRMGQIEGEYYSVNSKDQLNELCNDLIEHITPSGQTIELFGVSYPLRRTEQTIFITNSDHECPPASLDQINSYKFDCLIKLIKSANINGARELLKTFQHVDVLATVKGLNRKERKEFLTSYFDTLSKIAKIEEILRQRTLSNRDFTNIFLAAREGRNHQRLTKVVDKRVEANLAILKDQDAALAKLVEKLVIDDKFPLSEYTCMMTLSDGNDVIEDGSCLGVCMSIKLNPAAAVDPTRLVINAVGPSMVDVKYFIDNANMSSLRIYDANAKLFVDASRQNINAVLPLYLNETHWPFAELLIRRAVGLLFTGDPAGATNALCVHAYGMLACYLTSQPQTEHNVWLFKQALAVLNKLVVKFPNIIVKPVDFVRDVNLRAYDLTYTMLYYHRLVQILDYELPPNFDFYLNERSIRYEKMTEGKLFNLSNPYADWVRSAKIDPNDVLSGKISASNVDIDKVFGEPPYFEYADDLPIPRVTGHYCTDWLIFRQIELADNATSYCQNYVDYIANDHKVNHNIWRSLQDEYHAKLKLDTVREHLSHLVANLKDAMIDTLDENSSLEDFARIVGFYCLLGVNIYKFAVKANTPEKMVVLITGHYNGQQIIRDINLFKYQHCYCDGEHFELNGVWLPNRYKIRKLGWIEFLKAHNPIPTYDVNRDFV